MARYDNKTHEIIKRLQSARLSLMAKQPFYALLLMNMHFSIDLCCESAYTDGNRIAFSPDFMDSIDDRELEFVLMHEVLHAALAHPFRHQSDYSQKEFDIACDVIVNSNILYSFDMDRSRITLKNYGESMHLMPDGTEGYLYSVEEAYKMLLSASNNCKDKGKSNGDGNGKNGENGDGDGSSDGGGDGSGDGDGDGNGSSDGSGVGGGSGGGSGDGDGNGDGSSDGSSDGGGSGDGKSGKQKHAPTLEELIASIKAKNDAITQALKKEGKENKLREDGAKREAERFDDHSFWEGDDEHGSMRDTWMQRMIDATDVIASIEANGSSRGKVPLGAERIIEELKDPLLDWRQILCDFVQEEICDYSFTPPDRRMDGSPFFLPDFNEKDESAKDLLFMIDTSASMSNKAITDCYSEIYGAIGQFNGRLTGKLGFFDAVVVEPLPFEDEEEFRIIRPKGGGGTSFHVIFDYVRTFMQDDPPSSIIILTDGEAPFPSEEDTMGIPVLWIINNKSVTPPFGMTARLIEERKHG